MGRLSYFSAALVPGSGTRLEATDLLGGDPLPWLVLALGAALSLGTVMALVRAAGDPDEGELARPPLARSLVMIGIGLVAAIWALASLLHG
jgi:hypothetical protein